MLFMMLSLITKSYLEFLVLIVMGTTHLLFLWVNTKQLRNQFPSIKQDMRFVSVSHAFSLRGGWPFEFPAHVQTIPCMWASIGSGSTRRKTGVTMKLTSKQQVLLWVLALPEANEKQLSPGEITELMHEASSDHLADYSIHYTNRQPVLALAGVTGTIDTGFTQSTSSWDQYGHDLTTRLQSLEKMGLVGHGTVLVPQEITFYTNCCPNSYPKHKWNGKALVVTKRACSHTPKRVAHWYIRKQRSRVWWITEKGKQIVGLEAVRA